MSATLFLWQALADYDANRVEEGDEDWFLARLLEGHETDRIALARELVRAAGYAVVPREATVAMKNAAWMHVTVGLENGWDGTMADLIRAAIAAAEPPDA
jgi:hypothetical protein